MGWMTMKIINSTKRTSMRGVTLMSARSSLLVADVMDMGVLHVRLDTGGEDDVPSGD
jgi:hypothetical protein